MKRTTTLAALAAAVAMVAGAGFAGDEKAKPASLALGALRWKFGVYLPYPYRHAFNRQHHWELGRGYSIGKITSIMERQFDVVERFRIKENPYHVMWVLRSRRAAG